MAGLRRKMFHIEVFFSVGQFMPDPGIVEQVEAFTEVFAIQRVLRAHGLEGAACVYVVGEGGQGLWLADVCVVADRLVFRHPIYSS